MVFGYSIHNWRTLGVSLALVVVVAAGITATQGRWSSSAESANEARAIRQLTTSRVEREDGTQVTYGDRWTLIDESGQATRSVGWYTNEDGSLQQVQVLDAEGELIWWGEYLSSPMTQGPCVEKAPLRPTGINSPLEGKMTADEAIGYGYQKAPGPAPEIPVTPAYVQVDAKPISTTTYNAKTSQLWSASKELGEGYTRTRQTLLGPDDAVVGFWSATFDASGKWNHGNSYWTARVETYDADVFEQALAGAPVDAATCS